MSGTVYLVGAGCGNPDLITWKGLRLLRACDAVLYDDLSSPKLLEETRTDCERLFVGKRYGRHSMPQAEINALLVAKAQEGKTVVRLKGGDPFVFGRGGEEVLALQAAGIPYEVVSGVSSAVAVPAAAGIPVTHRRLARSFHVITGHTAADGAEDTDGTDGYPCKTGRYACFSDGSASSGGNHKRLIAGRQACRYPCGCHFQGNNP
ncbi:MAG: uroporphyrinogen-III C-methyltransferase [Anaerotignum faecicola]